MVKCPYVPGSFSVCDSNTEHISHWYQFSNVTFQSLFIFSFLILGIILFLLSSKNLLYIYFSRWEYYLNIKRPTYLEIITKWLSLFEHSPPANTVFLTVTNELN